jgi:hypothetical protein
MLAIVENGRQVGCGSSSILISGMIGLLSGITQKRGEKHKGGVEMR